MAWRALADDPSAVEDALAILRRCCERRGRMHDMELADVLVAEFVPAPFQPSPGGDSAELLVDLLHNPPTSFDLGSEGVLDMLLACGPVLGEGSASILESADDDLVAMVESLRLETEETLVPLEFTTGLSGWLWYLNNRAALREGALGDTIVSLRSHIVERLRVEGSATTLLVRIKDGERSGADLSMGHGSAGVLLALSLSSLVVPDVEFRAVCIQLAKEILEYPDAPRVIWDDGEAHQPRQYGMCMGPPSTAYCVAMAGAYLSAPDIRDQGVDLCRSARSRCAGTEPIWPAYDRFGICHGLAGEAQLLARLASTTGDKGVADQARDALRKLVERIRSPEFEEEARQLASMFEDRPGHRVARQLEGMMLALSSAVDDRNPWWDIPLGFSSQLEN